MTEYKRRLRDIWNEVAPRYHERWAGAGAGPFRITAELGRALGTVSGSRILDIGCGTGVVTNLLAGRVGPEGRAVGLDASLSAVRIASRNGCADFVVADAERACLKAEFDVVTCQFALFFFPDAERALRNIREVMGRGAVLAVAVHGAGSRVPFFSVIRDEIARAIPDMAPPGAPDLDRFGTAEALREAVEGAGFCSISIREYEYEYSPGTPEEYWEDYLRYVAAPVRARIDALPAGQLEGLRRAALNGAGRFERDGVVYFPWQVLLLTAKRP